MLLAIFEHCLNIFNNLLELLEAYSLPLGFLSVFASVIMILQLLRLNREYNAIADEEGFNLLHLAAIKGDIETARCLIEKGAEVDAKTTQGKTPLYIAARMKNYNVLELLIQKGANVNEWCPDECALFVAENNCDAKLEIYSLLTMLISISKQPSVVTLLYSGLLLPIKKMSMCFFIHTSFGKQFH